MSFTNLRERKELLASKQMYAKLNKELVTKKAEGARLALKAADTSTEISDDELQSLKDNAVECVQAVSDLEAQIEALGAEAQATDEEVAAEEAAIEEAEKTLKEASNASLVSKSKTLGGTHVAKSNYLKTKQSSIDFAKHMQANIGQKMSDVIDSWEATLKEKGVDLTTKDVTGLAASVLPEPVLVALEDAFDNENSLINHFSTNPLPTIKVAFQTVKNVGRGQKRGAEKNNSTYAFLDIKIDSGTVYAKYPFDYADIKKDTSGTYFNYVNGELAKELIRLAERAAIIGDGLEADDADKVKEIKSIAEETDTNLVITQDIDLSAAQFGETELEALSQGLNKLRGQGQPIVVTSQAVAQKFKYVKDAQGRYLDPRPFEALVPGREVTINGFTFSIQDWMDGATNPIIAFSDKAYMLNGDTPNADNFEWYNILFNQREVELASVMGGRLVKYHSGIKFVQKTATA